MLRKANKYLNKAPVCGNGTCWARKCCSYYVKLNFHLVLHFYVVFKNYKIHHYPKVMQTVSWWLCQWILQQNAGNPFHRLDWNLETKWRPDFWAELSKSYPRQKKQYFSYKCMCQSRSLEQRLESWIVSHEQILLYSWSVQSCNRYLALCKIRLTNVFYFQELDSERRCLAFRKCWSPTSVGQTKYCIICFIVCKFLWGLTIFTSNRVADLA